MTLTIYVAASVRHKHAVRLLQRALIEQAPVQILDWTDKAVPPPGLSPAQRREWYDTEQAGGRVFAFCADACVNADLVIYYGASGQDAGVEVGLAAAAGVPVLGLAGPLEAPGLMLYGAVGRWVQDVADVIEDVRLLATCNGDPLCCINCRVAGVCPRFQADRGEPLMGRVCRVCGCTDDHACPGGCYWVEEDLCSACAAKEAAHGQA